MHFKKLILDKTIISSVSEDKSPITLELYFPADYSNFAELFNLISSLEFLEIIKVEEPEVFYNPELLEEYLSKPYIGPFKLIIWQNGKKRILFIYIPFTSPKLKYLIEIIGTDIETGTWVEFSTRRISRSERRFCSAEVLTVCCPGKFIVSDEDIMQNYDMEKMSELTPFNLSNLEREFQFYQKHEVHISQNLLDLIAYEIETGNVNHTFVCSLEKLENGYRKFKDSIDSTLTIPRISSTE